MLFSSITFLAVFLPAVLALYYMFPHPGWRNAVLLCASLLFYAWGEPRYVLVMLASIVFNYNVGLRLPGAAHPRRLLALAVAANLGALFAFKYLGFSCQLLNYALRPLHLRLHAPSLSLPIGISFYTFQGISYLVDVYRDSRLSQHSPLRLGLYIALFPQLIAGPIVRYGDVAAQIAMRTHTPSRFASGMERFIVGLAKKVLLANSFALVCDRIYGADFAVYGAYEAWAACLAYALHIYYDFSGYSDMAIGLARMFGFELRENFDHPYAASSVTEFWRRWHISLTGFFRDYVYIPLGGNRRGRLRTARNRLAVFLLTGLWHGASAGFVLWGLCHGALMTVERAFGGGRKAGAPPAGSRASRVLRATAGRACTLLSVALLWVLFRNGVKETLKIVPKMFGINYTRFTFLYRPIERMALFTPVISPRFFLLAAAGVLCAFPWWRRLPVPRGGKAAAALTAARYAALLALLVLCYASLAGGSYNPFIYFRF